MSHRLIGFSGSEPIWVPDDRASAESVAEVIDRIYRERRERRVRAVIPYPELRAAEDLLPMLGDAMTPDEHLDAINRRSVYVACRRVQTVDQEQARRAGL